jgi:FkbM family methyltransferase
MDTGILSDDKYERWLIRTQPVLDFIDSALTRTRTAVDAGAAEGLVTRWLAERFERVWAFEPVPKSFALLREKPWPAGVVCHNVALGDKAERRAIEGRGHSAHVTELRDGDGVQVCRLDDFDIADVDLIKIDVEGFESRVIAGAARLIARDAPMIMFERKKLWQTRYNDEDPQIVLEKLGYAVAFRGPLDTVMTYRPEQAESD